jgi:uncharacterized caspase-like protein
MSSSYPEKKQGLFTYFLLKGLGGEADSDGDYWVSVKEVYGYVRNRVVSVSRRMGAEQTPVLMPSSEILKDMAIVKVLK